MGLARSAEQPARGGTARLSRRRRPTFGPACTRVRRCRCSKLSVDGVDSLIRSCPALRALNVHGALADADAARIERAIGGR
jgi:hypothetical protein